MNKLDKKRVKDHVDSLSSSSVPAECLPELLPRRLTMALRQVWHTPGRSALGGGILAAGLAGPALGQIFELSDLDGHNGFAINGLVDTFDRSSSGASVSNAGDVNGDGIGDIIIGAPRANHGPENAGQSYVVFGSSRGFSPALELSDLDGSNGFLLNGIGDDHFTGFVSRAGDVNGDGIGDIIIGSPGADPNGNSDAGQSYVVFGSSAGFSSALELSDLDGHNGFTLNGINALDGANNVSGAGDVNGDGLDDILIGAPYAAPNGRYSGQSYVVFGSSAGFGAVLELSDLDGHNGFAINGIHTGDWTGFSVSNGGDVNGDGLDDIFIGALLADPNGDSSGQSYVVFGSSAGFSSALELSDLDGHNGFAINGIHTGDGAGFLVSNGGDVNGDGLDDMLIGAPGAAPNGESSGQAYVVFGLSTGFGAVLELSGLDGSNGFILNGINAGDDTGFSASGAGDVNGDGLDDILIGAPRFPEFGSVGESYVVFGSSTFSPVLELSALSGHNGFILNGIAEGDHAGISVSNAGDVNDDGIDDILIGAFGANFGWGQSYVVFGTAADGLGDLRVQLEGLIAEVKDLGIGQHNLIRELNAAIKAHERDRLNQIAGRLKAFIRQVGALRGGEISHADADALIIQANEILHRLLSGPLEQLEELIAQLTGMDIAQRPRHELLKDLDIALEALAKGRVNRAASKVRVFAHRVKVLRGKKISEADAEALLTPVRGILKRLLSEPVALLEGLLIKIKAAEIGKRPKRNLIDDLTLAGDALVKGRINRSINMLGVFIHHVEALRGRKIADADADAFITQAEAILDGLR